MDFSCNFKSDPPFKKKDIIVCLISVSFIVFTGKFGSILYRIKN